MKKILILYFSGAGSTKKVAKIIQVCLKKKCNVERYAVENAIHLDLNNYDAFIIGTPVYHAAPCDLITKYFENISPLKKTTPAFLFNTRAISTCNTNRILAKQINKKNIITIKDSIYRSPASDGSLIVPYIYRFFEFEKNIKQKINVDCIEFIELLQKDQIEGYTPRFRFSSIINAPNKLVGQLIHFKIYLHHELCIKCGKCGENCPHKAIRKDNNDYPLFILKYCENCYRCIHHCPVRALSLSKRKVPKKLLKF